MNEFNFYTLGKRFATETLETMAEKGMEVKNKFGEDAQLEFEAGIISTISDYEYVSDQSFKDINNDRLSGTIKYGLNDRSNSYIGGYITDSNSTIVYSESKRR